jgi:hypothetical protein
VTASQLSAVINGVATILLFALIDPHLSIMTDDVVEGRVDVALFHHTIAWVPLSRLVGAVLAQIFFIPVTILIAMIASIV